MTSQNSLSSRWAEVVGMAWADDDFRQRLLNDPKGQMAAMGIELEEATRIRVVEETPGEVVLVVPRKPAHIQAMDPKAPGPKKDDDAVTPPAGGCGSCEGPVISGCSSCDLVEGETTKKAPDPAYPSKDEPKK